MDHNVLTTSQTVNTTSINQSDLDANLLFDSEYFIVPKRDRYCPRGSAQRDKHDKGCIGIQPMHLRPMVCILIHTPLKFSGYC